jgi:heme oxygenase
VIERPVQRTAASLREATDTAHRRAEQEPFIADLMAGRRSAGDLARLTGQLRPIYAALESRVGAMRSRGDLASLLDPRLDRLAALDHDLAVMAGDDVAQLTRPLAATDALVGRLGDIGDDPPRLLAHHYVRYLGDLSGGQIIARLMRQHYAVPDDALTFYAFDELGSKGGFKHRYRAALDELVAESSFYDAMLDEAQRAYEANRQVFVGLGASA